MMMMMMPTTMIMINRDNIMKILMLTVVHSDAPAILSTREIIENELKYKQQI